MKKTGFSEEQIIAVLREQEDGMKTADVCRKHGISSATLYAWKDKYGGCGSAWKRDPGSGVIGVEKGPLIPVV